MSRNNSIDGSDVSAASALPRRKESDPPPHDDLVSKTTLIGLSIAYLSVFIDLLGVSIILPIIPFLAIEFSATSQQIGFIYAGYAGAQMLSVPVSGKLSDMFGRRPMMLLSLFGSFAGFMFQGLAWNITSFICARVVAGAFGGSIPITQSYIADTIPVKSRGRYFAILGSVIITAFLFGPGIGAGLSQFSLQTPMFVAAGLALFGWITAFFLFKEPNKHLHPRPQEKAPIAATTTTVAAAAATAAETGIPMHNNANSSELEEGRGAMAAGGTGTSVPGHQPVAQNDAEADASDVLIEGRQQQQQQHEMAAADDKYQTYRLLIYLMWLVSFFQMCAFSSIIYFLGLFVYDQFGWQALQVGFTIMLMGVLQVSIQTFFFPKILLRLGKHGAGVTGCFISSAGMLLFGLVGGQARQFSGIPLLAISLAVMSLGNAIVVPSLSSVLSRYASQTTQGFTLGVAQACEALARTVGPILWGGIYSSSRHMPFQISTGLYAVAGTVFALVLVQNRRLSEHNAEGLLGAVDAAADDDMVALTSSTTVGGAGSGSAAAALVDAEQQALLAGLPLDQQVEVLLAENKSLRERLDLYEQTFDIDSNDLVVNKWQ